jgi:ATPase family protein associated with various cellular activities (AAA)
MATTKIERTIGIDTAQALAEMLVTMNKEQVHVAEVVREGKKIILPEGMTTRQAIKTLERQDIYDNELVKLEFDFDYFVWDGAHAFAKVMEKRYGFVFGEVQMSWFGDEPPELRGIEVNRGKVVQVPWGLFSTPSVKGAKFVTSYKLKEGRMNFQMSVTCKHMHEDEIKSLRDEVELYLQEHSIYKGKAISINFTDDRGNLLVDLKPPQIPTPKFLDLSKIVDGELVFSKPVGDAIKTNLFTVLEQPDRVRKAKIPLKRGILLAGNFGVGKTLTAYVAAQKAVKSGITYIYCQNPTEFKHVMRFAAQYTPALVFCEDVDRIVPLARDKAVDELINVIDGVETKNTEIVTVFTTNEVKNVNPALLRPGRMDAVILISEPDAEAVQQLVRNYLGKFLNPDADLTEIGQMMEGNIPSIIREVCERAKLSAISFIPPGEELKHIPVEALKEASTTMQMQLDLLTNRSIPKKEDHVLAIESVGAALFHIGNSIAGIKQEVKPIDGKQEAKLIDGKQKQPKDGKVLPAAKAA